MPSSRSAPGQATTDPDRYGSTSHIIATAQQSRFDSALLDPTSISELDLQTVNIQVGEKQLLVDGEIKLRDGVRYALMGVNGSGKSTIMQAIAERLIPGTPESLRIVYISQNLEEEAASSEAGKEPSSSQTPAEAASKSVVSSNGDGRPEAQLEDEADGQAEGSDRKKHKSKRKHKGETVLQHVVNGHSELRAAQREHDILSGALDNPDRSQGYLAYAELMLEKAFADLRLAQRWAARQSGARGKDARAGELEAEAKVEEAKDKIDTEVPEAWEVHAAELLAEVQLTLDVLDSASTEGNAMQILRGLGFHKSQFKAPFSSLSGGWRSRAALAVGLLVPSDLLLLDEPSNYMDLESIAFLEHHLLSLDTTTLVLVSHDQAFLDAVVDKTIVLRHQKLVYFDGSPTVVQEAEKNKRLGKMKEQAALDKKKDHILDSIHSGRKHAKATGDENRMRMVKSREKKLEERWGQQRNEKGFRFKWTKDFGGPQNNEKRVGIQIEQPDQPLSFKISSPAPLKTTGNLVHLEGVGLKYKGAEKATLEDVGFTVGQGEKVALVGRNGQGKTTLARIIVGEIPPSKGTVERHPQMRVGYFTQLTVEQLAAHRDMMPLSWFMEQTGETSQQVARGKLGGWGLQGRTASHTPIHLLSGGQKVRLALAKLTYDPPDLMILDEITTHLDSLTIHALALALRTYQGGLILITHDRWFSRVVVEGMHVPDVDSDSEDEGDDVDGMGRKTGRTLLVDKGKVRLAEGGMSEYEALARKRAKKLLKEED